MLHRVSVLERVVSRLSKLLPADLIASGSESTSSPVISSSANKSQDEYASRPVDLTPTGNTAEVGKPKSAIRSSYGSGSTDEDVAMMLEDFAMGHRVNRSRATLELERGPSDSYSYPTVVYGSQEGPLHRDIYEKTVHSMPTPVSAIDGYTPQIGLPDRHPLSLLIDPSINVISRLVSVLPNQSQCATLVHFYVSQISSFLILQLKKKLQFKRLEWYSKILHSPSFLSEASQLMEQVSSTSTLGVVGSECDPSMLCRVSVPFLSVYFMVLCLSLHLIEPEICRTLNIGFSQAMELSRKMYNAAQACFYVSDFFGNHSLEALQCLMWVVFLRIMYQS